MKTLRVTILKALKECGRFMLPEGTLISSCTLAAPGCSVSEVREALRSLEVDGYVVSARAPVTEDLKWKMTTEGAAACQELGI